MWASIPAGGVLQGVEYEVNGEKSKRAANEGSLICAWKCVCVFTSLQELQGCHCQEQVPALRFSLQSGQPTAPPAEPHAQYPPLTSLDMYMRTEVFITTHGPTETLKIQTTHRSHATAGPSACGSCNTGPRTHRVCWWFSWFAHQGTLDVWSGPLTSAREHSWDLPPGTRQRPESVPVGTVRLTICCRARWSVNRARWGCAQGWFVWGSTTTAP